MKTVKLEFGQLTRGLRISSPVVVYVSAENYHLVNDWIDVAVKTRMVTPMPVTIEIGKLRHEDDRD